MTSNENNQKLMPQAKSSFKTGLSSDEAASTGLDSVSGLIDHIVYRSEETGYTVCVLKPSGNQPEITVVGVCSSIWPGETLRADGNWIRHKQHGFQFNAVKMACIEPHSTAGIRKYLASGLIAGIGEVLAERLVNKFGADTLRVIGSESVRLESVEGIGRKKREQIRDAWIAQKAIREVMLFLHAHGVSTSQAFRIHQAYGDAAISLVKENPYRLAADIWGIGFKTADKIAQQLGVPQQSIVRARAGTLHVLNLLAGEGHCYSLREGLISLSAELLSIPNTILEAGIDAELESKNLIQEEDRIYLASIYFSEVGVASNLRRLLMAKSETAFADVEKAVEWASGRIKLDFAPSQIEALRMAITHKVCIITGGPGVGKTTIIRALVDLFLSRKLTVRMAAPTGRAAKRMEEATGLEAATLHRLLKFNPSSEKFHYNKYIPLDDDVYVIDEASMIDIPLMNALLRALPDKARLVLVGDADQLPSVGPGNLLRDLLSAPVVPSIKLDTVFRQSQRSFIVHNAHLVNTGRMLDLRSAGSLSDFYFIEEDSAEKIIAASIALVTERIPRRFGLNPKTDIQVLTPMKRYQLGADNLNYVLQEALNPAGASLTRYGRIYRVGDRVMQMRNNYDKDVYNGDTGLITQVDVEEQTARIDFDGRVIDYSVHELDEINLAYACSIHKAQGHEHPAVVVLLTTQHYRLLQRNLLYTAITRGRKLVCLIGSRKAVAIAIRNNRTVARKTSLSSRLLANSGQ